MTRVLSFGSGLVFALGLGLSGMTRPSKVIGFLDVSGEWDPSLGFVMAGALVVVAIAWRLLARRGAPLVGGELPSPPSPKIDLPLVAGSAIFGVGWGLGGYCPGPAIVALGTSAAPWVFVAGMLGGMATHALLKDAGREDPLLVSS